MFERFTEESRAVLVEAQDLALELGSPHIAVGHVLYGCAEVREATAGAPLHSSGITGASIRRLLPRFEGRTPGAVDPAALTAIGIDYEGVRDAVEKTFGPGALDTAPDRRVATDANRKPAFTPEAKRSLELALRATLELHQEHMRPGHLLLGLLRLDDEFVSNVIERSDSDVAELTAAVHTRLAA